MKEEQTMAGLPKDWKTVKVNDVCMKIVGGGTPSTQKPEYWQGDIPWISSADIYGIKDLKPRRNISLEAVKNSATNILPKGGIVVVTRVGLGKLAVAPYDLCFSQDSQGLILKKDLISTEYALLVLHQEVQNFKHQSRGTTINGVTKKQLAELQIALPPKETQQQIVSKIEELFSELDKGIEELKTAQQQLKIYRQAVLKWAFEGKLTNENVKDGELPEGWKWKTLSQVSDVSGGLTKSSKRESLEIKLPFLRVANVYFNELDLVEMHTIGIKEAEIERVLLRKDDLLFVEGNGSIDQIGRAALWNGAIENCVHQNHLIKSRFLKDVNPKYALYFFCSNNGREKIKQQANSTSGLHTLSLGKISKLELPVCSIEEQQQIVQEIESRLSVCDKIEETITASLKQAEALRQSILKKAFEGSL